MVKVDACTDLLTEETLTEETKTVYFTSIIMETIPFRLVGGEGYQ
jgi:hypothetical protein